MSKQEKEKQNETPIPENETPIPEEETAGPAPEAEEAGETSAGEAAPQEGGEAPRGPAAEELQEQLKQQADKYLRLFAEFDNYRKRTAKEKQAAWSEAKAETAAAFLPVYDNLERALKQETSDEAYKRGVEMTMNQLREVLSKLGIEEIPALGQPFDPKLHNAVMHVEDESLEENTVAEVFQAGFMAGEKVIRFAMVKVAN